MKAEQIGGIAMRAEWGGPERASPSDEEGHGFLDYMQVTTSGGIRMKEWPSRRN